MSPLKSLAALGLAASILLTGCDTLSPMVRDYRVMNVDHIPHTALDIVTANGSIKAHKESRQNVAIEVELYGYDQERLDFTTIHAIRQGDDTLRIWVEWPGGDRRKNEGAKIEIYTPGAQGITTKTSNGSVVIIGLAGKAKVATTNGSVHLENHQGPMDISTSNGTIRVDDSFGDIKFNTSNGRILISNADALVQGDTSNGSVYISTADGTSGPIRVRTTNGRIELDLGHAFQGRLGITTSNGRIKTDGLIDANLIESTKYSLKLQMGQSDDLSFVKTTNGSVRVHGRSND